MSINIDSIIFLALVFVRISAVIFALPIFGETPVPVQVRILLSAALSFYFFSHPSNPMTLNAQSLNGTIEIVMAILKEVLVGVIIGFVAKIFLNAITMAASFVGYQMGFGTADLFIPDLGGGQTSFTAMHQFIVFLLFFCLNFHHIFILSIKDSFVLFPINGPFFANFNAAQLIRLTGEIFSISLQLAAPVLIALMFVTVALGLVARTVPQVNVFVVSFPVGFFLGLTIYAACLPFFPEWLGQKFSVMRSEIVNSLILMAGK